MHTGFIVLHKPVFSPFLICLSLLFLPLPPPPPSCKSTKNPVMQWPVERVRDYVESFLLFSGLPHLRKKKKTRRAVRAAFFFFSTHGL
jgi:hypothetical protein